MDHIHDLIHRFLQQKTIIPLGGNAPIAPQACIKAGVVPFMRNPDFSYYAMKPHGSLPELGEPPFQLGKGTRQYNGPKGWRDMRDGASGQELESLAGTALREGMEELGLPLDTIRQLFDLGCYEFFSATTGKSKYMWLFAAEMSSPVFLPDSAVAETTQARRWLTLDEFAVVGRDDHLYILRDIEQKLARHFQE